MGGGVLAALTWGTVYFITPKLGFSPSPKVHVATGAMLIGLTGESESIGVYYGAATYGDDDQSVTGESVTDSLAAMSRASPFSWSAERNGFLIAWLS